MTLLQLFYFCKIAKYGSFSAAAENLYVSQPNLTKSIARLEKEFDTVLFERRSDGIKLTKQGKEFYYYAKSVLSAADNLENAFQDNIRKCKSQLFVASQQIEFLYDVTLSTYNKFCKEDVIYDIIETDRRNVIRHVNKRNANIGIIVRTTSDPKSFLSYINSNELEYFIIDSANVYICVGPKSPFYEYEYVNYTQAISSPQITLDVDQDIKNNIVHSSNYNCFNSNNVVFFNSIASCEKFLLETDCILYTSKWTIKCFSSPEIRSIPIIYDDNFVPDITELLWIKRIGEPLSPMEEYFIKEIYTYFEKPIPEF